MTNEPDSMSAEGAVARSCDACGAWTATPLKDYRSGQHYGAACDSCFRRWADPGVNASYLDSWPEFVKKARQKHALEEIQPPPEIRADDVRLKPTHIIAPLESEPVEEDWLAVWNFAKKLYPRDFHADAKPDKFQLEYVKKSWNGYHSGWYREYIRPLYEAEKRAKK